MHQDTLVSIYIREVSGRITGRLPQAERTGRRFRGFPPHVQKTEIIFQMLDDHRI
jgi:hypothetical protein